jgi:acylphosphatase
MLSHAECEVREQRSSGVRAQADELVLALFKQELRNGPPAARVGEVIEKDLPLTDSYSSFHIG